MQNSMRLRSGLLVLLGGLLKNDRLSLSHGMNRNMKSTANDNGGVVSHLFLIVLQGSAREEKL